MQYDSAENKKLRGMLETLRAKVKEQSEEIRQLKAICLKQKMKLGRG